MGWKAFVEGGLASIVAGSVTHPLDLIKVRMQLQVEPVAAPAAIHTTTLAFAHAPTTTSRSMFHPASSAAVFNMGSSTTNAVKSCSTGPIALGMKLVQTEGAKALFSGISAAVLRQALYSTTRLGLYELLKAELEEEVPVSQGTSKKVLSLPRKVAAGLLAGAAGAAVGNPADLAMVRMQADGRLPAALRANYANVGDALVRIVRRDGVPSLWTGSAPTVQRAMIVTAAQLASYDQAKESLLAAGSPDGFGTHVASSFCAGFVASVASNPIDVIKTRMMTSSSGAYAGTLDCAAKIVRSEGPMALYKGFLPTVARQGPFAVVLFVTLEQIRGLLKDV